MDGNKGVNTLLTVTGSVATALGGLLGSYYWLLYDVSGGRVLDNMEAMNNRLVGVVVCSFTALAGLLLLLTVQLLASLGGLSEEARRGRYERRAIYQAEWRRAKGKKEADGAPAVVRPVLTAKRHRGC